MSDLEDLERKESELAQEQDKPRDEEAADAAPHAREAIEERNRAQVAADLDETNAEPELEVQPEEEAEEAPALADPSPMLTELARVLLERFTDGKIEALAAQEEFINTALELQPEGERDTLDDLGRRIYRQYLDDARLVEMGGQKFAALYQNGALTAGNAQAEFLRWCVVQWADLDRDAENVKWGWVTYFARLIDLSPEPSESDAEAEHEENA